MMATRGCASLTPGYKPRLRLGLTCFACHRIDLPHNPAKSIAPIRAYHIRPYRFTITVIGMDVRRT